jgi:hypothetical protein
VSIEGTNGGEAAADRGRREVAVGQEGEVSANLVPTRCPPVDMAVAEEGQEFSGMAAIFDDRSRRRVAQGQVA